MKIFQDILEPAFLYLNGLDFSFCPKLFLHVMCMCAKSLQSCPTLCDPMDCSPPGSSVHGILQARILEWVAIAFSRESFWPGTKPEPPALQADSLPSESPGKPPISGSKPQRDVHGLFWWRLCGTHKIKNNTFESVLMRWMKLEPVIQSEVSQKEKHQYSILMHIYGL